MSSDVTAPVASLDFEIDGMTCGSCSARVQKVLSKQPEVLEAEVNYATGKAHVVVTPAVDPEALLSTPAQVEAAYAADWRQQLRL